MPATLSIWRPVALGTPELLALLIILLVCFSAPVLPTAGWRREGGSRLTRGEKGFLACLCVLLAVLVGALLLAGSSR